MVEFFGIFKKRIPVFVRLFNFFSPKKFRLLSVFCPSFLFLKFDIKNGLRFWKTEKIRKKNGNIKKNGKKTEKRRKFGKTDPCISVFWNFRFFSGIFPAIFRFFSVFQNAIRFYFFLKYGKKTEKKTEILKNANCRIRFFFRFTPVRVRFFRRNPFFVRHFFVRASFQVRAWWQ